MMSVKLVSNLANSGLSRDLPLFVEHFVKVCHCRQHYLMSEEFPVSGEDGKVRSLCVREPAEVNH